MIRFNCDYHEGAHPRIMQALLEEFPVHELQLYLPQWLETLPTQHFIKQALIHLMRKEDGIPMKLRQIHDFTHALEECEFVKKVHLDQLSLGSGEVKLQVLMEDGLFYQVLSETTGLTIENDRELLSLIQELSVAKAHYDRLKTAYTEAMTKGYGIVDPLMDELDLQPPMIVRQGGKHGNRCNL